jgi:hypothetical protein
MNNRNKIQLFEQQKVRSVWDEDSEKWYFSVQDVVQILTESTDVKQYVKRMLSRDEQLRLNWGTICTPVEMIAADGKMRKIQAADMEGVLRIIQSIPSKKAEPLKMWLAKVGSERIDESIDPELSIERAIQNYRRLGYSENWINQRIKSIEVRKALTDEWDKAGVQQGEGYAFLTDLMYKTWSDMTTKQYKQHKGLKKENLRDNMTNVELILNMLAEASATELSQKAEPANLTESAKIAVSGAEVAKDARKSLELRGGEVVSQKNAKQLGTKNLFDNNQLQENITQ